MKKIKMRPKIVAAIVALVVIAAGSYLLFFKNSSQNEKSTSDQETVNLQPATEEELQQAVDNKKQNDDSQAARETTPTQGNKITPVISGASVEGSAVEVSGYVPNLFENDGTCTVTFTKNETLTRKVGAVREGSSTFCPLVSVPTSEFRSKGTWSVTITYTSPLSNGTSEPAKFEVN